jgi:hypothetical protein
VTSDEAQAAAASDEPSAGGKKTWTPPEVEILAMSEAEAISTPGTGGDIIIYS